MEYDELTTTCERLHDNALCMINGAFDRRHASVLMAEIHIAIGLARAAGYPVAERTLERDATDLAKLINLA